MDAQHNPDELFEHRQLKFIEKFGTYFEKVALPPMAGRILGWLLICEPPQQSMHNLTEVLQASKGSISTSLQLLTHTGLVERVRVPGERRNYFLLPEHAWSHMMKQRLAMIGMFKELAQDGMHLMKEKGRVGQRRLQNMHDLYVFWEQELPALFERWEQEQRR